MKKLICPVDFSETANNAVEYAARLANYLKSELTLIHIINEPSLSKTKEGGHESSVLESLETYCQAVRDDFSVKCSPIVKGNATSMEEALKKEIETNNYNMLVMGTNGRSDLSQFFLGTHTNHIIGEISLPILVVPLGCDFKELEKVVYASNYQLEDIPALNSLMVLTQTFNPYLTVLHVNKTQSEKEEEIRLLMQDIYQDKLENNKIIFDQVLSEDIAMALDSYVTRNDVDLLVLVTHKYSWIRNIFHDSVTKKMSLVADYPILVQHFDSSDS